MVIGEKILMAIKIGEIFQKSPHPRVGGWGFLLQLFLLLNKNHFNPVIFKIVESKCFLSNSH